MPFSVFVPPLLFLSLLAFCLIVPFESGGMQFALDLNAAVTSFFVGFL